jgi:serine/threonine-protein kinase
LFGEAQRRLVERGLVVDSVEEFDEVVPAGTVISWSVPGDPTLVAGSLVEPETPVRLVVSAGPVPREVPAVVGRPIGEARTEVEALGLVVTEAPPVFSDDVGLGVVISQSIEPGTEVARGSELVVVVSLGPDLVSFPDLSAATSYEEAADLLRAAGFEAELVFGDAQGAIRSYVIDGNTPETGETFRRGTLVQFEALDPA